MPGLLVARSESFAGDAAVARFALRIRRHHADLRARVNIAFREFRQHQDDIAAAVLSLDVAGHPGDPEIPFACVTTRCELRGTRIT